MLKGSLLHMSTRRLILILAAAPIAVMALTAATDNAKSTVALPDSAVVTTGKSVRIDVLANDTYSGSRAKVTLRVIATPKGMTTRVAQQRITLNTKAATPGTYTMRYRLTDTRGSRSTAKVKVKVTAAGTTTTTPTGTPTPTPTATATPTATPTAAPTATPTATDTPTATPTVPPTAGANTLMGRINALPVGTENRTGYNRDLFKHWNAGLPTGSGGIAYCDTRREVLIAESVITPTYTGTSCTLTGQWYSYYDGVTIADASSVDMDHMVPLAEAWDSGASAWTDAKREAYANDQGDPRSLVGVTFSANRGKGDQDPGEWWPLLERCRYAGEWTAVKTRWGLTVDQREKDALLLQASQCENVTIEVTAYNG